jgi:hypothetical protein
MRPKARIRTIAGEIVVKDEYQSMLDKWKTAISTSDPVIEATRAAGGSYSYPEEVSITIAVSQIISIEQASNR